LFLIFLQVKRVELAIVLKGQQQIWTERLFAAVKELGSFAPFINKYLIL